MYKEIYFCTDLFFFSPLQVWHQRHTPQAYNMFKMATTNHWTELLTIIEYITYVIVVFQILLVLLRGEVKRCERVDLVAIQYPKSNDQEISHIVILLQEIKVWRCPFLLKNCIGARNFISILHTFRGVIAFSKSCNNKRLVRLLRILCMNFFNQSIAITPVSPIVSINWTIYKKSLFHP